MSQYPSPYSPPGPFDPGHYAAYAPDPAAPARRAAMALMILGAFMIVLGICAGICSTVDISKLPDEKSRQNYEKMDKQIREKYGLSLNVVLHNGAIQMLIAAIVSIGVGLGVRTGRRPGIVVGIILVTLLLLTSAPALFVMPGVCTTPFFAGVVILLCFIMRWLMQALQGGRQMQTAQTTAQAQYQWQVQQYQQQLAAYTQAQQTPQTQQTVSPGVQRIDHAAIDVFDVERTKAFYGGTLGLPEVPRPASFDFGGAWYRIGQADLHLVQREKPESGGGRHVCFWVGDVRALAQRIEAAGFKIDWDTRYKIIGVDRFFMRDPDGNRLEFQGSESAPASTTTNGTK